MRKALIIAYYWPPAGGPGVQRWLKFVTYLREFGIEPVVYIPDNPEYPIVDEKLLSQVPEGITIIRKPIFEPTRVLSRFAPKDVRSLSSGIIPAKGAQSPFARFMIWVRGNLFIPDARVFWVKPSVAFLKKYLREHQIDTVITTGPPHSLHLIGMELKKALPIQWIADFRDPWTTIGYHKSLDLTGFAERRHMALEQEVLESADEIIVTSPLTRAEFAAKTSKPITVITNGYDIKRPDSTVCDEKFSVSHIGSLLARRNPVVLWQALAELVRDTPGFADDFELHLVGTVSQEVIDMIKMYDLDRHCFLHGYVAHDKAVALQQKSQVLLIIEINSQDTKCIIPGKLFEYMVSGRPVLGIGPAGSDFAAIIRDTEIGVFADYSEKEVIKSTLLAWYQQYLHGALTVSPKHVDRYSRRNLTAELATLIRKRWES